LAIHSADGTQNAAIAGGTITFRPIESVFHFGLPHQIPFALNLVENGKIASHLKTSSQHGLVRAGTSNPVACADPPFPAIPRRLFAAASAQACFENDGDMSAPAQTHFGKFKSVKVKLPSHHLSNVRHDGIQLSAFTLFEALRAAGGMSVV
jgi:hypothetical protein